MPPENVITGWSRRSARSTISSIWSIRAGMTPAVDAVQLGVQAEVLRRGELAVERRVLEHEADVPADVVAFADDVEAAHTGGARRWAARACRAC